MTPARLRHLAGGLRGDPADRGRARLHPALAPARPPARRAASGARLALAVAAAAGIILNLAIFIAFGRITVALALLAFYTYPAFVAAVAIVVEQRRPGRIELLALALALAGMVLVVAGQLDPAAGLVVDGLGLGLALLAAVAQTVYITRAEATQRCRPSRPRPSCSGLPGWPLSHRPADRFARRADRAVPQPGRLAVPARGRPARGRVPVAPVPGCDPAHRAGSDRDPGDARAGHRDRPGGHHPG